MASKKEERTAFERLKKEFPGEYVLLECSYTNFRTPIHIKYSAYHEGLTEADRKSSCIEECATPNEAIDVLIRMRSNDGKDST